MTEKHDHPQPPTHAYDGYRLRPSAAFDAELTSVGPGTPGGEY